MNHILILLIWRQTIWGQIRNGWEGGKPPPVESCRGGDLYLLLPPVESLRLRTFSSGNVAKLPSSLSSSVSEILIFLHPNAGNGKDMDIEYGGIRKVKSQMCWVTAIIFTGEKSTRCIRIRFPVDNQDPRCILGCCWIIRPKRAIWGWSLAYLILLRLGYLLL